MFTGIVEETGEIKSIRTTRQGIRLTVASSVCAQGSRLGDSIAVNGCCLTLVAKRRQGKAVHLGFDLLKETWERTNLQYEDKGGRVNLERSMAAGGRFGGHFVTGHIDGMGTISKWERVGDDHVLDIDTDPAIRRYIVFKGSIAVDGISLTVAKELKKGFRIWVIPHTYEVTHLRDKKTGDRVNLEADLLGKYVERFVAGKRL